MKETKYTGIYVDNQDIYKLLPKGDFHKLSKWVDNVGYYRVSFRYQGKKLYKRVHRLVAETTVPNPEGLPFINHKDNNRLNNSPENLEWCTNSYNTQAAYDTGRYKSNHRCPVKATSLDTGKVTVFTSIRSCADTLHVNRKTLTNKLKNEPTIINWKYRYEFEYV